MSDCCNYRFVIPEQPARFIEQEHVITVHVCLPAAVVPTDTLVIDGEEVVVDGDSVIVD